MNYNISYSLIRAFDEMEIKGSCGIKFYNTYITKKIPFISSKAMDLGVYFEYICTGQKPRNNKTPEPVLLKSGKLSTDYERMNKQKLNFDKIIKNYNIKIKDTGKVLEYNGIKGILDIEGEIEGQPIIIDIKTSGLINDKWSEYGWYLPRLSESPNLLQSQIYKYLYWKLFDIKDVPFYYLIFSTKNDYEVLFVKIQYYNFLSKMEELEKKINYVKESINYMITNKCFEATKDYTECLNCNYKDCIFRRDIPEIKEIKI